MPGVAEVLRSTSDRTPQDVLNDLDALLAGVGDDAPLCQMVMSTGDFGLIRGIAGRPGMMLARDYPSLTKLMKMQLRLDPAYTGKPRIVRALGNESFDAHAEKARRDQLLKTHEWRENDARLRRGINGTPLL